MPGKAEENDDQAAPLFERWIVQCPGSRRLAARDENGKWRDVFDGAELPRVLAAVRLQ